MDIARDQSVTYLTLQHLTKENPADDGGAGKEYIFSPGLNAYSAHTGQ
jgi:hypothetical protein